jgi:hypothetical protein
MKKLNYQMDNYSHTCKSGYPRLPLKWIPVFTGMTNLSVVKLFTALALITVFATFSFAETGAASFLRKGVGAKALSMGGAFTSIADDTSAMYWNPAGLAYLSDYYSVAFMAGAGSSDKYDGLSDVTPSNQFFAFTLPLNIVSSWFGQTVFGFGYIGSSMDNIPYNGIDAQSNPILNGTFSDSQRAFLISAGLPLYQSDTSLYLGASLRYITENWTRVDGASANGYDLTAGLIYSVSTFNFGVVLEKGAAMTWEGGHQDTSPLTSKFGVSNIFTVANLMDLVGAIDLVQRHEEPLEVNLGAQFGFRDLLTGSVFEINGVFVRGGVAGWAIEDRYDSASNINQNITYSLGLGTEFSIYGKYLQLDMSYGMGNVFDEGMKLSLNFYF